MFGKLCGVVCNVDRGTKGEAEESCRRKGFVVRGELREVKVQVLSVMASGFLLSRRV